MSWKGWQGNFPSLDLPVAPVTHVHFDVPCLVFPLLLFDHRKHGEVYINLVTVFIVSLTFVRSTLLRRLLRQSINDGSGSFHHGDEQCPRTTRPPRFKVVGPGVRQAAGAGALAGGGRQW